MIALTWTDPAPPNGKTCFYDHVTAETPLGQYRIEWKSWKRYDAYVLSGPPTADVIEAETNLDDAKACAQKHFDALVSSCMVMPASDLREAALNARSVLFSINHRGGLSMTGDAHGTCGDVINAIDRIDAAIAASPASKPDEAPDVVADSLIERVRQVIDSQKDFESYTVGRELFAQLIICFQAERRKREAAEAEVVKLRRLDAEYGRVESAIIMADPDFDGDSNHANCGDRLIASVNRLADKARP